MAHAKREVEIETVENHKFTNNYDRAKIEYERAKEKFDKNTAKVVKVYNEALGPSAREWVKDFLLIRHQFRAAWAKLDEYYNTQEEVDTS